MRLVDVERHPLGRRVRVWPGWRWHHYHTGAALILAGARLIWGDRRDLHLPR